MHYSIIKENDVSNGPGVRVSLFVSGCNNACPGCFNKEAQNPLYGYEYNQKVENEIIDMLKKPYVRGLSILGGDPFYKDNAFEVLRLCGRVKEELPDKDIWLWTGYSINDEIPVYLLADIDVVVDGRFEIDKKDLNLKFRGSSNQRIIDLAKTRENNWKIVLWEG